MLRPAILNYKLNSDVGNPRKSSATSPHNLGTVDSDTYKYSAMPMIHNFQQRQDVPDYEWMFTLPHLWQIIILPHFWGFERGFHSFCHGLFLWDLVILSGTLVTIKDSGKIFNIILSNKDDKRNSILLDNEQIVIQYSDECATTCSLRRSNSIVIFVQ